MLVNCNAAQRYLKGVAHEVFNCLYTKPKMPDGALMLPRHAVSNQLPLVYTYYT